MRFHHEFTRLWGKGSGKTPFAKTYETVVKKPESYYSFLDMLLVKDEVFVQGDFVISVYRVKREALKHLSTKDKLGTPTVMNWPPVRRKGQL